METLVALVKPDWRRLLSTLLMLALLAAAFIQAYAFVDDVPGAAAPLLYDLLRPFDFWVPGMMLILPLALLTLPLQWLGLSPLISFSSWPLQMVYCYVLSSLLIFSHDQLGQSIQRKRLIPLVLFLIAALLWTPTTWAAFRASTAMLPFLLSSLVLSSGVLSLYTYTAFCIGIILLRRIKR